MEKNPVINRLSTFLGGGSSSQQRNDMSSSSCPENWKPGEHLVKRISAFRVAGRSITDRPGYYGLDVFLAPDYPSFTFLPFFEAKELYFDNHTYGTNLGLGGRYLPAKFPPIVGFNIFGSYYHTDRGPLFQMSLGFELIAKNWEISANGYIPIGDKHRVCKNTFKHYIGNYKVSCMKSDASYPGFNLEASLLTLQYKKFFLYTSGGPYFFASAQSCTKPFWGGQFGIQPMYDDLIGFSFSVSYDPVFGTLFQGKFVLSLPLYSKCLKGYRDSNKWIKRQIYQPVKRLDAMPINKRCYWKTNF